jgi:hypothetical protein
MRVPEVYLLQAWDKAGAQCECTRQSHGHTYGRCTHRLVYENRGSDTQGGWAPRYCTSNTTREPLACEILCMDCYNASRAEEFKTRA